MLSTERGNSRKPLRLTKRIVETANPSVKDMFLWDGELKGFGLKVTPKGRRVFVVQYWSPSLHRTRKRITLGTFGAITVDQARDAARQHLGHVANGEDPASALSDSRRRARDETLAQVSAIYLEEARSKIKPRSFDEYDRAFRLHILPKIGTTPVALLTPRDIAALHLALRDTPYQANRTVQYLSAFLNWTEARGYRPAHSNPCARLQRFPEHARERFLSGEEVFRLASALRDAERDGIPPAPIHQKKPRSKLTAKHRPKRADTPIKANPYVVAAIRFLLLTGWREQEALTLRWEYVDMVRGAATLPRTKSGKSHRPLGAPAIALLEELPRLAGSAWVFPGAIKDKPLRELQRTWCAVRHAAGFDGVRLHDLRHTVGAFAARGLGSLQLTGMLLGHVRVETTQRYSHLADDVRKTAADIVSGDISNAMNGTVTPVTPLQPRKELRRRS